MERLFKEHDKRNTFLLNGVWKFVKDEKHIGETEQWYLDFPKEAIDIAVPSCINNRLGMMEYQDVCWYKKEFQCHEGLIKICFGAVSEQAKVYLDGEYLGEHYGGFTSFEFVKKVYGEKHTLVLRVDPRSTEDTIPLYEVDWHHYCGIIRSVEVSELADVYIDRFFINYDLSKDLKNVDIHIEASIFNMTEKPLSECVKFYLNDQKIYEEIHQLDEKTVISVDYYLENVKLWDIHKSVLYEVKAELNEDDLIDRIGFRKIQVSGNQLLLNGKQIKLKGVNRHEEHPDWGFAVPLAIMQRDMDILKNLNVNMVRGSHYPNSKYFLDMCDAEGILFWSEIPMWGFGEESVKRELVQKRGMQMHEEMIRQYFHHPSIIIWGLHNEIVTDTKAGYDITKLFAQKIRSLDNSRLLTYASNRILKDECLDLIDFISVNQYIGWYEGDICEWEDFLLKLEAYLKEKGMSDKPVVMSEFGVGAIYGNKNFEELRWSENYQMNFYEHTIPLFLKNKMISGVILWQFADIRSNAKWSLLRVRSFNNKGLVNEYRHPKLAYYKVKELFELDGASVK